MVQNVNGNAQRVLLDDTSRAVAGWNLAAQVSKGCVALALNAAERIPTIGQGLALGSSLYSMGERFFVFQKNREIHTAANQENPNRSYASRLLTHPFTSIALRGLVGYVTMQELPKLTSMETLLENPAIGAMTFIALLPHLASSYQVGKKALTGLKNCCLEAGASLHDRIVAAGVHVWNLYSEVAHIQSVLDLPKKVIRDFVTGFEIVQRETGLRQEMLAAQQQQMLANRTAPL